VNLSVAGAQVPGATFDAATEIGVAAEVGWYVSGPVAVSAMITSSVLTENTGTGSLAATPELGADSFMLGSITAHYHFNHDNWFRPYIGGGFGYFHPTGSVDGLVTDLEIEGAWGSVFQLGADFDFTDRWGAFVDVKQFLIGIEATGLMMGDPSLPVTATADIDPLVITSGLNYRF
jgi:outer membrane protein W